jgi:hypothetical protein
MVLNGLLDLQETRLKPDDYTWPAIWKACQYLLDTKKDMQKMNHIFELCVRSGAINELVFNNIRNVLPTQYLQKKLKTDKDVYKLTVHDLPSDWTKNTRLGRFRPGKGKQAGKLPKRNVK